MADKPNPRDAQMDADNLWREEIVTDRRVGTIRVLQPIRPDGSADAARTPIYAGEAQLMTNMGPLPINFEIEANNLSEAVQNYGAAAAEAYERAIKELQEMRRQAASSIVLPGQGGGGGGFGPGGMPGLGGGGKIQMP